MLLPQPRRQPQYPLHPFEFIQPILRDLGEQRIARRDDAGRATCADLRRRQRSIFAQSPFAVASHFMAVFVEEYDHWHPVAAVDLEFLLNIRMGIAIEVSDFQNRRGLGEAVEDRALSRAIAAPGPGEHQHVGLRLN